METFGKRLKAARLAARLTEQEMYERMEIPPRTVKRWERGFIRPPKYLQRLVLNELEKIAEERAENFAAEYREQMREMRKNGLRRLRYLSEEQRKEIEERRAAGESLEDIFESK